MQHHPPDPHAALLPYLAPHRLLDRLARLLEPRKCAVPEARPAPLPPEQDPLPVGADDGHDDRRVGAGEAEVRHGAARGAGLAGGRSVGVGAGEVGGRADPLGAGVDGEGRLAALRAKGVARVPVEERAGVAVGGC